MMDGDTPATSGRRTEARSTAAPQDSAPAAQAVVAPEAGQEPRRGAENSPEVISQIEAEIPRLRRFARAMVRDTALADDLVQECLERALSRLHLWQPGTNLRAWLFTILRNLHINGIRRQQTFVDIDGEVQTGLGGSHGSQVVRLELRDLRRALDKVPQEQREVVLLIGLEGISYAEAAEILDVSIGTVKSRLSRGRRALRLLMDGGAADDGVEPAHERETA
ncbi:sigma-70 family RNA polymerase sigma factor [Indioceanicola profundi]|uniref:sigma-70 family RNA polymerase sigma factor n=1 Tax=Indioceanicola profundi TaxID=2220096 RepID=UPI001CEC385C|nr:sigma-70 family RNA polymerase sigma factor [Indioceanicola profundi]